MGITTDLSAGPYYDDFENAESKNYHRILFKPATAVQARELTQLQSILQDQVEKFGDNILVDGTVVKGGNFVELVPLPYVKILDNDTDNRPINLSGNLRDSITGQILENITIVGVTSGVEARLVTYKEGFQTQTDKNTLFVKYIKAADPTGTYENQDTFRTTENIRVYANYGEDTETVVATYTVAGTRDNAAIGNGYGVRCGDGIVYQKGHFINFIDQVEIVERYSTSPTDKAIGFSITEELITANQDETLFDNAAGFNNFNAPGADRLKLTPTLSVRSITEARDDDSFFILQEYNNGRLVRTNTRTQYNVLGKEMARRTKEESGNYSIKPFDIRIEEFDEIGYYSDDYIKLIVSPGTAYVEGERVELINEYATTIEKSLDNLTQPQQNISINYGNYIEVENLLGVFDSATFDKIELHGAAQEGASAVPLSGYATGLNSGNVMGTARVRGIKKISDNKFRLYLFDICMTCANGGKFEDVKAVSDVSSGAAANLITNTANKAVLYDDAFKSSIFNVGRSYIKSVTDTSGENVTDYVYTKKFTNVSVTTNTATLDISDSDEQPYVGGAFNRDQRNTLVLIDVNGNPIPTSAIDGADGSTGNISIDFNTTINGPITAYAQVRKNSVKPIFKELFTGFVRINANTHADLESGQYTLGIPDVYKIEKIWLSSSEFTEDDATSATASLESISTITEVTSQFTLFDNQKESFYDYSYIQKKPKLSFSGDDSLLVKYTAFTKNTNDGDGFDQSFFSVDSYPYVGNPNLPDGANTISLAEIPTYQSESGKVFNLRDSIDFRPYAANLVSYSADSSSVDRIDLSVSQATSAVTFGSTELEFPDTGIPLEVDFEYYLGRVDKVYLTEKGYIQVEKGIPSENPKVPEDPKVGMVLGTIYIPPYPSLPGQTANRLGHPEYAITHTRPNVRGYTMSDIAKLDKRVKNIEYYTTLNTLEKAANDATVKDNSGIDRFKNGIFVDSFEDLRSANTNSPEFAASIDPSLKEIAPRTRQFYLDLVVSELNNVTDHGEAITLEYINEAFITQPYATNTKSCTTNFYRYNGTMQIYPEYDGGAETSIAPDMHFPDIDVAGVFADFADVLNESVPFQRTISSIAVETNTAQVGTGTSRTDESLFRPQTVRTTNLQTTTTTSANWESTEITVDQTNVTTKVGEFVTDVRFLPFMRSRDIEVEIFGMMPNKRVYFYFDGEDVNAHIAPAVKNVARNKIIRTTGFKASNVIRADENGVVRAIFRIPENRFYVGDRDLEVSSASIYVDIDNAITYAKRTYRAFNFNTEKTSAFVTTRVPTFNSNTSRTETVSSNVDQWEITQRTNEAFLQNQINDIRRTVGENSETIEALNVRISDNELSIEDNRNSINSLSQRVRDNVIAISELDSEIAEEAARITALTTENSTLTTRINNLETTTEALEQTTTTLRTDVNALESNQAATVTVPAVGGGAGAVATPDNAGDNGGGGGGGGGGGSDPIAQTFYVEPDVSTDDLIQVTQVEVFFSAKSSRGNGVTAQLVETVNGYPGQTGVPFGAVHLDSDEVTVTADGTIPTTFVFPAPVTLRTDRDYALIVQPDGNDPDYRVWISKTGGTDIDRGIAITQDTNAGVLFTSTNKKAWTPYQDENMKFTLYKAKYTTSSGSVKLTNNNDEFFDMEDVTGAFKRGEYAFKYKPFFEAPFDGGILGTTLTMNEDSNVLTASVENGFLGIEIGDKLVYEIDGGVRYGLATVVEAPTQSASGDTLVIEEFPEAIFDENGEASGIRWIRTCVGKVNFYSVSSFDGDTRLFLSESTANSDNTFINGDKVFGADSGAYGTVTEVMDQPISKIIANIYKSNSSLTRTSLKATKLYNTDTENTYEKNVTMNAEQYLFDNSTAIRSRSNEVISDQTNTFELELTLDNLSGGTRDTSPFLDHDICNILGMEYMINDISSEYEVDPNTFPYALQSERTVNGNSISKYVTKTIELSNGQNAADLQLYLTAYRPPNTDIYVYTKLLSETDNRVFNNVEWSIMKLADGTDQYSSLTNRGDYKEFKFVIPTAEEIFGSNALVAGGGAVKLVDETTQLIEDDITYQAPNGSSFDEYKYFSIKIVFSGSSHSSVPRIQNIRAIALAGA